MNPVPPGQPRYLYMNHKGINGPGNNSFDANVFFSYPSRPPSLSFNVLLPPSARVARRTFFNLRHPTVTISHPQSGLLTLHQMISIMDKPPCQALTSDSFRRPTDSMACNDYSHNPMVSTIHRNGNGNNNDRIDVRTCEYIFFAGADFKNYVDSLLRRNIPII